MSAFSPGSLTPRSQQSGLVMPRHGGTTRLGTDGQTGLQIFPRSTSVCNTTKNSQQGSNGGVPPAQGKKVHSCARKERTCHLREGGGWGWGGGRTYSLGLERWLDLFPFKFVPVDVAEEGVLLNISLPFRATPQALRRMLGHELETEKGKWQGARPRAPRREGKPRISAHPARARQASVRT